MSRTTCCIGRIRGTARWIALGASAVAVVGCGHTSTDKPVVSIPGADQPWFDDVTTRVGIDFVHDVGATGEFYLPEVMAGGLAVFDADNDGRMDIYFVQCNHELPEAILATAPVNRLYRQRADGTFDDATIASGLGDGGYGMGAAVGDIDNSGFVDVYVTNFGPDQLYHNQGDGTFENITDTAGIDAPGWSCSAAFVDLNHSGYLDLYVTQYLLFDHTIRCFDNLGRLSVCSPSAFEPVVDLLWRNNGDRTFTDISSSSGITAFAGAGLGVICDDFDDDGWPDIYVTNDGYANNLWTNQRDETFVDRAVIMGVAFNLHGMAEASMGVVAADFSGTRSLDLFMTHLTFESNTFFRRSTNGAGWDDHSMEAALAHCSVPLTGFGVVAMDTLRRGSLDLAIANGRVVQLDPIDGADVAPPWDQFAEPNLFHFNDGTGRFITLNGPVGAFTEPIEISRGLAISDLDGDGALDLVLANIQGPPRIYRNVAPCLGRWLMVDAIDPRLSRHAIGARVYVTAGGAMQMRTINPAYSYLSSCDHRAHFGLGQVKQIDAVDIDWPDGLRERFINIAPDQHVRLLRGDGVPR